MFGKKNKGTVHIIDIPAVQLTKPAQTVTLPIDEYKALLRKEAALDLIVTIQNDPDTAETMKYNWPDVLAVLCKAVSPMPCGAVLDGCVCGCECGGGGAEPIKKGGEG